jgi:hypothetical protein
MDEYIWGPEHERVLAEWADKANCYNWLHTKCHEKFHELHIWYTVPVIVMSTLTGTANFAQSKIPVSFQGYATMIIGAVNITAGIITTVQQFLKINELNEGHRVASIAWDKFYRRIKVELSKKPEERPKVVDFFKSATDEFDRLMETSPSIEPDILKRFEKTFARVFEDGFEKPEICNSLVSVKTIIYKKSDEEKKEKMLKELVGDIMMVQTENQDTKHKLIKEFYQRFEAELRRPPTKQEIMDNLMQDELSITEEQIDEYLVGACPYDPNQGASYNPKGVPVRSIGLSLPRVRAEEKSNPT